MTDNLVERARLAARIEAIDTAPKDSWQQIVLALLAGGFTDDEVGSEFAASPSTLKRWKEGGSPPREMTRRLLKKMVLGWLGEPEALPQTDLEQRAMELLATEYERDGNKPAAFTLRQVGAVGSVLTPAVRAITKALAFSPVPEQDSWQPIKTAPRDGTWFLAAATSPGWGATRIVRFKDPSDRLPIHGEGVMWPSAPTHWMPLPPPPAISGLQDSQQGSGSGSGADAARQPATRATPGAATASPPEGECQAQEGER